MYSAVDRVEQKHLYADESSKLNVARLASAYLRHPAKLISVTRREEAIRSDKAPPVVPSMTLKRQKRGAGSK